jgi:Kinesin motor domain
MSVLACTQVMGVFTRGNARRSVAATNVHERSSRSHSVLMVDVIVDTKLGGTTAGGV